MILLVSGASSTLRGIPLDAPVGHLVTPHTWNSIEAVSCSGRPWAADNGCGPRQDGTPGALDEEAFEQMMQKIRAICQHQPTRCWPLFVVVPDVVADAEATLERWYRYQKALRLGLMSNERLAFVAQDGSEQQGMIPWGQMYNVLFVGGSTEWKESPAALDVVREAKDRGLRVHIGRVNSERRLRLFDDIGRADDGYPRGIDSIDGTQFSMFPDKYIPRWCQRLQPSERERYQAPASVQNLLFDTEEAG